jgi:hypothetical protein
LPKKIRNGNQSYPSLITINGRGKDRSPKGLADDFHDLWYDDLVQAQAIRASFLLESNAGFDRCSPHSLGLGDNGLRRFPSPLNGLLERGLFEPEQGEGQMWGQRNSKYAAAIGTQLLAKIHVLDNKIGESPSRPVGRTSQFCGRHIRSGRKGGGTGQDYQGPQG